MNIFDFDKTIYRGDSSFEFLWFNLRRRPSLIIDVVRFVWRTGLYFLGLKTKLEAKEALFGYLPKLDNVNQAVRDFWQNRSLESWYLELQRSDDAVVSASPRFLIEPFLQQAGIRHVIASEVDAKTGKFLSPNCYGSEKIKRLRTEFPKKTFNQAYSDSLSDLPMLKLAKQAFIVERGQLVALADYQPSLKTKLKQQFLSREFVLFLGVGVINAINGIVFASLYAKFLASANLAFVLGYLTSLTISYLLNSWIIFREKLGLKRYIKFAISYIPNFVIQNLCVIVFYNILHFDKLVTFVIAVVVGVPVTFLAIKLFAFSDGSSDKKTKFEKPNFTTVTHWAVALFLAPCLLIIVKYLLGNTNVIYIAPVTGCLMFVVYFLAKIKPSYKSKMIIAVTVILALLAVRLYFVNKYQIEQVSDFGTIIEASRQFAAGDYSYKNTDYFMTWGFNIGQVIYQGVLLRFFGSEKLLLFLNALYGVTSIVLVYLISRKLYSSKASAISAILFSVMVFPTSYVVVMSNQHLYLVLSLIAIYIYLSIKKSNEKSKDLLLLAGVGALLALANVIRPESIVFVLPMVIWEILDNKGIARLKRSVVVLVSYFAIGAILSFAANAAGFSNVGFKNANPLFKFRTGLNLSTNGSYSHLDQQYIGFRVSQGVKLTEIEKELLRQKLKAPKLDLAKLFVKKIGIMWSANRLDWFNGSQAWSLCDVKRAEIFDNALMLIIVVLVIIGLIGKFNVLHLVLALIFTVYMLVKIQTRYILTSLLIMAILSSGGSERVVNWVCCKVKKDEVI